MDSDGPYLQWCIDTLTKSYTLILMFLQIKHFPSNYLSFTSKWVFVIEQGAEKKQNQ